MELVAAGRYTGGMDKHGGTVRRRFGSKGLGALIWSLAAASLPLGCSDDDGGGGGGTGASGGSAGKGGSAGQSGAGGKGGTAGRGGGGGNAGQSGNSGSSGNAGAAGEDSGGASGAPVSVSGSGGASDAGAGGEDKGGEDAGGAGSGGAGSGGANEGGAGASGDTPPWPFTSDEWAKVRTLTPLGDVPPDPTNEYADDLDAAALGQKFFFEKAFSGALADLGTGVVNDLGTAGQTERVACASCHFTGMMSDHRSLPDNVSLGANFHSRNAPAMVNSSFYEWTNWGGRFSAQWELPMPVTESGVIMNSTRLRVAHVIFDQYKDEYEAVFSDYAPMEPAIGTDLDRFPANAKPKADMTAPNGPWEEMDPADRDIVNRIFVNYGKALAAYTRRLVSRNAPFDQFVAGDSGAISDEAKLGLQLFVGSAGCIRCHDGSTLSDGGFHNIGVAQTGPHVPASDDGRFKDIPPLLASTLNSASSVYSDDPEAGAQKLAALDAADETQRAAFRTPSLRGVADTAPYMHSGQLATLGDVIDFYDRGGDIPAAGTKDAAMTALSLSDEDKANLVAFLNALTGEPVPAALREDTSN